MLTRNALVTLTVDGQSLGTWITKGGGATKAEDVKIRLGGMSEQVAFGGPAETENVTAQRVHDTYMQAKVKWLRWCVSHQRPASLTETPLDNDKRPSGPSETFTGIISGVTPPDRDDNSAEVAMIEVEISTNESVA